MTGRLINIEWQMAEPNSPTIVDDLFNKIVPDLKKSYVDNVKHIFLCMLMEGPTLYTDVVYKDLFNKIKQYSKDLNFSTINLIGNLRHSFQSVLPYYFFDTFLRGSYESYKGIKTTTVLGDKIMFLGGVTARNNRLGMMKKLYERQVLDKLTWSFFKPVSNEDKIWCRNYCNDFTDTEYESFLQTCQRSIDGRYDNLQLCFTENGVGITEMSDLLEDDFVTNYSWIDPINYADIGIEIVSEGMYHYKNDADRKFVTEKFWRAVLMKKPFLISGYVEQYQYIKELGFKTFEEYFVHPNYAYIEDNFDLIIDNALQLLKNKSDNIKADIEYNYQLLLKLVNEQENFINDLQTNYMVPIYEIETYLKSKGLDTFIKYEEIYEV